ncbi:hypothetical protein SO802_016528 [Lithocarpus litseifolius]|uniref:Uncharacterized protein n=1 Tax=Lithocarpus litseifolius TaxID=425828 RepID=A0AAW2CYX0_9ROSI
MRLRDRARDFGLRREEPTIGGGACGEPALPIWFRPKSEKVRFGFGENWMGILRVVVHFKGIARDLNPFYGDLPLRSLADEDEPSNTTVWSSSAKMARLTLRKSSSIFALLQTILKSQTKAKIQ